jgi:hypothetical protein
MKKSNGWLKSQYEKIKDTVNISIQEVLDTQYLY